MLSYLVRLYSHRTILHPCPRPLPPLFRSKSGGSLAKCWEEGGIVCYSLGYQQILYFENRLYCFGFLSVLNSLITIKNCWRNRQQFLKEIIWWRNSETLANDFHLHLARTLVIPSLYTRRHKYLTRALNHGLLRYVIYIGWLVDSSSNASEKSLSDDAKKDCNVS